MAQLHLTEHSWTGHNSGIVCYDSEWLSIGWGQYTDFHGISLGPLSVYSDG